jgi:hypothetical protein
MINAAESACASAAQEIWRDYNRRADVENRTAELRHDLGAGGFCMKQFSATEAVFRCKGIASYAADMLGHSPPPMGVDRSRMRLVNFAGEGKLYRRRR